MQAPAERVVGGGPELNRREKTARVRQGAGRARQGQAAQPSHVVVREVVGLVTADAGQPGPAPDPQQVKGLTFSTLSKEQKESNRNSYNVWDVVFSLIVIGIVIYVMTSFTG